MQQDYMQGDAKVRGRIARKGMQVHARTSEAAWSCEGILSYWKPSQIQWHDDWRNLYNNLQDDWLCVTLGKGSLLTING